MIYFQIRKEERRPTELPTHREMLNELNWNIFKCIQFVSDRWIVDEYNPCLKSKQTPVFRGGVRQVLSCGKTMINHSFVIVYR
jgi:hypothetical protein